MSKNLERQALHGILQNYAVPSDAVLIVHSAIKGLSRAGYRAEAMIEALLDYLNQGTLLMPTMTWRTVTPSAPLWDELATPSHTGVLTEIFRTHYASARSLHPTHSVAGSGVAAQTLLATHHLGNTPAPATSPYGMLKNYRSYILLIGVGLESCTAIHHPEEIIAPDIYLKPAEEAESYQLRTRNGDIIKHSLRRHKKLPRDFPKFAPLLVARSQLLTGDIAGVPWMIMKASDLIGEVSVRLTEQPDFNIC